MGVLGGIVLLFFALLAAGCGSSSDEALSKSEFLKQANAICKKATSAKEKVLPELLQKADPGASLETMRQKAVDTLMTFYEGAAEEIGELGAPKGDEAKVEAILEAMEEAAADAKSNPQSVFGGAGQLPFRKANKAAESYGLKSCIG